MTAYLRLHFKKPRLFRCTRLLQDQVLVWTYLKTRMFEASEDYDSAHQNCWMLHGARTDLKGSKQQTLQVQQILSIDIDDYVFSICCLILTCFSPIF